MSSLLPLVVIGGKTQPIKFQWGFSVMSPLQFGFIDAKKTPENLLDPATQR